MAHSPGAMEAPIVKEYSDTEILLQWDHPKVDGNAPILCYQLEVRENGNKSFRVKLSRQIIVVSISCNKINRIVKYCVVNLCYNSRILLYF